MPGGEYRCAKGLDLPYNRPDAENALRHPIDKFRLPRHHDETPNLLRVDSGYPVKRFDVSIVLQQRVPDFVLPPAYPLQPGVRCIGVRDYAPAKALRLDDKQAIPAHHDVIDLRGLIIGLPAIKCVAENTVLSTQAHLQHEVDLVFSPPATVCRPGQ